MEEIEVQQRSAEMARSSDPNYSQFCGLIPKTLINKVKMLCLMNEMNQSEALEEAFKMWVAIKQKDGESDDDQ